MLCITCFLCFFCICYGGNSPTTPPASQNIEIEAAPYHVSIEYNGVHFCSGVIIDVEYVLTAAHCLFGAQGLIEIRAGSSMRVHGGTRHRVISIRYPEDYNFALRKKDVALYRVKPPFDLDSEKVSKIKMAEANQTTPKGALGLVTGFGFLQLAGTKTPVHLKSGMYPVTSDEICNRYFKHSQYIFCAKVPPGGGVDNCLFDHGAPMVIDGVLVGIASGSHCGKARVPNTYSKISAVRAWIDQIITNQKKNIRFLDIIGRV